MEIQRRSSSIWLFSSLFYLLAGFTQTSALSVVPALSVLSVISIISENSTAQEVDLEDMTVKTAPKPKKLPPKTKIPEGNLPLDPRHVQFQNGVPDPLIDKVLLSSTDFEGVIQFLEGDVKWKEAKGRPEPKFKTILRKGDELILGKTAYVKVITQKRCIGVVYGPGNLTAPRSKEISIWETFNSSTRWICPNKNEEKLIFDGRAVTLFGGDLFYHKDQLLVRNGEAQTQSGTLVNNQSYEGRGQGWETIKEQPSDLAKWKFYQEKKLPKEITMGSSPEREVTSRYAINIATGGGALKHALDEVSKDDLNLHGIRLTTHQFYNDKYNIMATLAYTSSDNRDNERCFNMNCGYNFKMRLEEVEVFLAEIGLRFKPPKSSWSWYSQVGFGESVFNFNKEVENPSVPGNSLGHVSGEVNHSVLSINFGIDKIFWPTKVFGLIITAELQHIRSVGKSKFSERNDYMGSPPSGPDVEDLRSQFRTSPISITQLMISFGPILNF